MIIDSHAHAGIRSELDWDFASVAEHRAYDQRLLWTRLNIGRKLEVRRWGRRQRRRGRMGDAVGPPAPE